MSIKRFCDMCGEEIVGRRSIVDPVPGRSRLATEVRNGDCRLGVEVITSHDGTANTGDFCRYCVLDALYALDDRAKAA